jgi:transposase
MGNINRYDQGTKDLIVLEYKNGKSIAQLYRTYGISEPTITKWLRTAGVEIRKTNGGELNLNKELVNESYHKDGLSTYQIAEKLGCSDETIRRLVENKRDGHQPHSEKTKQKIRERSQALWQNPSYRELVTTSTSTIDYKRRLSEAGRAHTAELIARTRSPEMRAVFSRLAKSYWLDQAYRDKVTSHTARRCELSAIAFKSAMADPDKRLQWLDKLRKASAGNLKKRGWVSSAQRQLYFILRASGIEHHEEGSDTSVGPFYVVDCVIPMQQGMARPLIVEVQGEYWHSLPHVQTKDRQKHTYVRRHTDFDLLYLDDLNVRSMDEVVSTLAKYGLTAKTETCSVNDLIIKEIGETDADEFYSVFHYSGRARKGSHSYGAFLGNEMIAAISYSGVIRQESAIRLKLEPTQVSEVSRIARRTNLSCRNLISFLLSKTRKLLSPSVRCLISFSDHTFGHTGAVYKAAGFVNDGEIEADYCYISMYGRYHKKTIWDRSKQFKMGEMEYAEKHGLVKLYGAPKTRWIYRIATS